MKKANNIHELRSEYNREDIGKGVRGKYYEAYKASHNLVLLNPEVANVFPNEKAVNKALMSLIKIAKISTALTKKSSGR